MAAPNVAAFMIQKNGQVVPSPLQMRMQIIQKRNRHFLRMVRIGPFLFLPTFVNSIRFVSMHCGTTNLSSVKAWSNREGVAASPSNSINQNHLETTFPNPRPQPHPCPYPYPYPNTTDSKSSSTSEPHVILDLAGTFFQSFIV
jgi:hypothetical protein